MALVPTTDRWLLAWGASYAAVGAASLPVPLYAITLGAGAFLVGLNGATAAIAGVPGALLWGCLAERTCRHRSFVLIGHGLSTIALAAIPFANSVTIVIVANAILWFAVSAAASVLTLLAVANVHEHDWDQRIGVLNKYQGYGWLLGLLAGAAWNAVGSTIDPATDAQRLFFFALAATTALGLAITADRTTLATLTALGYRQRSLTILVTTQPITITTAGTLGITDGLLGIDAVNALDSQYAGTGMGGAVPHAPRRRRILVAVLIRLVATPYLTCLACRTSSHEQLTT